MGVEKRLPSESSSTTRLSKSHSVDIYRPPPLRRKKEESTTATTIVNATPETNRLSKSVGPAQPTSTPQQQQQQQQQQDQPTINDENTCNGVSVITKRQQQQPSTQTRRERRPDRAVYIPRARRSQTTPPTAVVANHVDQQQPNSTNRLPNESVLTGVSSKAVCGATAASYESNKTTNHTEINHKRKTKDRLSTTTTAATLSNNSNRKEQHVSVKSPINEGTCIADGVFKSKKYLNFSPSGCIQQQQSIINYNSNSMCKNVLSNFDNPIIPSDSVSTIKYYGDSGLNCSLKLNSNNVTSQTFNEFNNLSSNLNRLYPNQHFNMSVNENDACHNMNASLLPGRTRNLRIEDAKEVDTTRKCDIDSQELQKASKEINRSNRRIMKQTFVSDVLEIPDKSLNSNNTKNEMNYFMKKKSLQAPNATDSSDNEEFDDWDSMYDESGECLDPKIIQELTASVGKVKIELPKLNYSAFDVKQSLLNGEEFPHVLEVSNFPVEFKNQDLLMVFSQYKESGFDIKWVDDTHALAVFSSSRVAAEVLANGHPFVVLKPLAEATMESRLKAKKCAASLQPYRQRPETCAALARRLVTGALGVRLKTAAAERENEKRVLREAKERKLLAAKHRNETWES